MEGREALRASERVFIDTYTSVGPPGWAEFVGEQAGRAPEPLGREKIESGETVLEAARRGTAALAVLGDAVFATTHSSLVESARRGGIETRIVPGVSILSLAVAATGLQSYKFGRVTTIPRWKKGFEPLSPLDPLKENIARGMHTLVLLDTGDGSQPMGAIEGGKLLLEMARRASPGSPLLGAESRVIVLERLGWDDEVVSACHFGEWDDLDFGPPPHALVIPGELHVSEAESIRGIVGGKFGGW